jgi:potassium efflux system protein
MKPRMRRGGTLDRSIHPSGSRTLRAAVGRTVVMGIALGGLVFAAHRGEAQPTPTPGATTSWVRPVEVPAWADALLHRLAAMRPGPADESTLAAIEQALPAVAQRLDAVIARAMHDLQGATALEEIEDVRGELMSAAAPLDAWKRDLAAEAQRRADALDTIGRETLLWSQTRDRPEIAAAGPVVVQRVQGALQALDEAGATLDEWRRRVIDLSDRVIARAETAEAVDARLEQTAAADRAALLVPEHPPLWSRTLASAARQELPRVPEALRANARSTLAYIVGNARALVAQFVLAVFLMVAVGRVAARARAQLGAAAAGRSVRVLERPYATALLLALLATPALHPLAPRRFLQLVGTLALLPAARVINHVSAGRYLPLLVGLLALLVLDRVGLALASLPALERAVFLLTLVLAFALAAWVARRGRLETAAPWLRRAARGAMLGLALAFVAELGGWSDLATLVGRGIIAGALIGLFLYVATSALAALAAWALVARRARRGADSRTGDIGETLRRWERALDWLGFGIWVYLVLMALGLRTATGAALRRLFEASVSAGTLSLSVGNALAFVVTIVVALLAARVVTDVLEEDVYPRARLPRGVPYALSTLVRYGIYSLGFLFALAAAGVNPGQVAIMVGGLGIGIGLGLQDLVKNFAAGLTLLLERRIQVGDTVELPGGGVYGRVLSIGTRASLVRTLNGAEVVVPNADLISSAVTNWTLSDRLCRIEVPVGVAYGSDPERVVAQLLKAPQAVEHLLADPAPQALFKGFGDSSLDFVVRAWSDLGYEHSLPLASQLGLAVHRVLEEAGITIPFPQRDLHLASVSSAAEAALGGGRRER